MSGYKDKNTTDVYTSSYTGKQIDEAVELLQGSPSWTEITFGANLDYEESEDGKISINAKALKIFTGNVDGGTFTLDGNITVNNILECINNSWNV